jgi:hypothetical protein
MKIVYAVALALLMATPALADQVTFTCTLTGSDRDGFDIHTINTGPDEKRCSAACEVTKKDGSTKEFTYSSRPVKVSVNKDTRTWFDGETNVSGKPLSAARITQHSCD